MNATILDGVTRRDIELAIRGHRHRTERATRQDPEVRVAGTMIELCWDEFLSPEGRPAGRLERGDYHRRYKPLIACDRQPLEIDVRPILESALTELTA